MSINPALFHKSTYPIVLEDILDYQLDNHFLFAYLLQMSKNKRNKAKKQINKKPWSGGLAFSPSFYFKFKN